MIVTDFLFLGSKITVDGECSYGVRRLLLSRKAVTNLGSVLKSRDTTLLTEVHRVKAMVFPLVTYGYESWTIKKAECQRIDAFQLWCWRRLLKVPWTARRSNQSVLREINPEYSLVGLMLNLKLQYFGHLMRTDHSLEKSLMLRKIEQKEKRTSEDEMADWHHRCNECEVVQTLGHGEGQGGQVCYRPWGCKESDMTERLNNQNNQENTEEIKEEIKNP